MLCLSRIRPLLVMFLVLVGLFAAIGPAVPAHGSSLAFGSPMNLSNNLPSCAPTCSALPSIATSGSNVYVAWLNNTSGNSNVLFRASNNNGSSFGPIINLSNSATEDAINQEVATVGTNVYVVWEGNFSATGDDVLFRASTNSGASFGSTIDVSSGISGLITSIVPDIAVVGSNVYIAWLAETKQGSSTIYEILLKASTTNGSNLGTVAPITLSTKASSTATPQIAALTTYVYATWSDLSPGRAQTFFTVSSNSGSSFGPNASPNSGKTLGNTLSSESDVNQEIAAGQNSVYVAWTNTTFCLTCSPITTDNTMFTASTNNGVSFGTVLNLNKAPVTDLNPELAAFSGHVYVVWSDAQGAGNTEVLFRTSGNNGTSFGSILTLSSVSGTSNQQKVSVSGSDVYITWTYQNSTTNVGDGIRFVSSSDNGSTFGTPINVSSDTLSSSSVVEGSGIFTYVAWEDDTTGNGDIYFERGGPASPPTVAPVSIRLNENQSQIIALSGNDPAGFSLTFSIANGPSHGTLGPVTSTGANSAQVTYTPNTNYTGSDSFTYKASDGTQTSSPAAVSIVVVSSSSSSSGGGGGVPPREM